MSNASFPRVSLETSALQSFLMVLMLGLSACGREATDPDPIVSVTVTPASLSLRIGESGLLTADVRRASGAAVTDREVIWTRSDPAIATVSEQGLVTAIGLGSATFSATIDNQTGSAAVTVSAGPAAIVTVSPGSASVQVQQSLQLTATAMDAGDNVIVDLPVTWSSADPDVASVTSSGLVTGLKPGGPVALSAIVEGETGSAAITINPELGVTVAVNPASASILVNQTVQLTATATDASGNVIVDKPVTWHSADPTVTSVSASGLVSGLKPGGPVSIKATVEGKSGSATITVTAPRITVTVTPASVSVQVNQTVQLTATATDPKGAIMVGTSVTWTSADPAVASVSSSGLVTGLKPGGPVNISATVEGETGSAAVTVSSGSVTTVEIGPAFALVEVGKTVQLTATAKDANGNVITGRPVSWRSEDQTVASVSSSGLVTGLKAGGPLVITATVERKGAFTVAIVAICKESISLPAGEFTIAERATTAGCAVSIDQSGEYLAIPYFPEVAQPLVGAARELPHTAATLHLIGGASPSAPPRLSSRVRQQPAPEVVRPHLPGVVWHGPDLFMPETRTTRQLLLPCAEATVGSPLPIPTLRHTSGELSGYYRDIGGELETWRVAFVTNAALVAVDSAFWLRLPNLPSAQANLASLAQALEASVLPTMARFGIARQDFDGDGRTLILVPETPAGANACAAVWNWTGCSQGPEGILIPTSRFQSSSFSNATMADGVNTMMHEMFHLYEFGARPPDYAWYASEGTARLAEHVWRVATSSGGSPFAARRTALPVGSYAGVSQQLTTPDIPSKHCVDPTLDGFDYLRVYGNIRAYDTGCWFTGRVAAGFEAKGIPENMIFPLLVGLPNQATMVEMWNAATGESRTPVSWRARWLAAMALEENGVPPGDATIRDPMWDLSRVIQSSAYVSESRLGLAPTLDAQTTIASLDIIDQSAQAARLHVLAGAGLVLRNGTGGSFGSTTTLQLLLVRLN